MHPRSCVSAISTFRLPLDDDLAFWDAHHITNVGVSVAKLEAFGWDAGTRLVADAVEHGLRVVDLIGLGPFRLADPSRWDSQRERLVRSIETAAAVGFVHTLRDALDLARRLDTGVCMELNACWAERALADTIRAGAERIRLVQVSDFRVGTIASSQRLVPGDGDMPIARILAELLAAGYGGFFELELIGDAIVAEGYDTAIPRAVGALDGLLRRVGA